MFVLESPVKVKQPYKRPDVCSAKTQPAPDAVQEVHAVKKPSAKAEPVRDAVEGVTISAVLVALTTLVNLW